MDLRPDFPGFSCIFPGSVDNYCCDMCNFHSLAARDQTESVPKHINYATNCAFVQKNLIVCYSSKAVGFPGFLVRTLLEPGHLTCPVGNVI